MPKGKRKRRRHPSHLDAEAATGTTGACSTSADASVPVMEDVMEQLRKQRAKGKAAAKEREKASSCSGEAEGAAADGVGDNENEDRADHSSRVGGGEKRRTMGKFRYDPIRRAYFPVSSKGYNPNDVVGQSSSGSSCLDDGGPQASRPNDGFDIDTNTPGNTVDQIALRLSNGRRVNRGRNNHHCPSRTLLHAHHVASEITSASVLRRHRLRSEMASALHFAGGIHLRPAARRIIPEGTDGDEMLWQPLLEPLPIAHSHERSTSSIATDCLCKHELHPSARTFDVMSSPHGDQRELPHVVTIIGGGGNGNNIHYRESRPESEGPFTPQASQESNSRATTDSSGARRYHCVRFAPFMADHHLQNCSSAVMGALSTDAFGGDNCSTLTLHRGPTNADVATPFVTKELHVSHGSANGRIDAMMNDFVFSPDGTIAAPGLVAFAPGLSSKRRGNRPIFLDFETMQTLTQPKEWRFVSEALCVEHLNRDNSDGFVYGHRNGVVSILDYRANVLIYTSKANEFGSIQTLESLSKVGKPNEFLAKGSFGSCRLFDIRKLSNAIDDFTDEQRAPALVHEMFCMDTKPSQRLATASSGCVGMAIDTTGTTLLSPCVKGGEEWEVCLGFWNLSSGAFLREISLASVGGREGASNAGQISSGSRYCELIGGATRNTWHNNEPTGGGLGAWVKFDPQLDLSGSAGGAIHNVSFGYHGTLAS